MSAFGHRATELAPEKSRASGVVQKLNRGGFRKRLRKLTDHELVAAGEDVEAETATRLAALQRMAVAS